MPHLSTPRRKPAAIVASAITLLACVGLTACGGSSSTTTTTAANAAATSTTTGTSGAASTAPTATAPTTTAPAGTSTQPGAPRAGRFAAVRECLQKNGVTLPQRPAGGGPGGFLGGAAGGAKLPKGMTRAQYEEVLKKCGGGLRAPGAGGARRTFDSPRFRQALTAFAACLRQNGIDVPTPNTNGKGPIFDTKGIDTASPKFRQAEVKCRPELLAGLRARPGVAGSGTAG